MNHWHYFSMVSEWVSWVERPLSALVRLYRDVTVSSMLFYRAAPLKIKATYIWPDISPCHTILTPDCPVSTSIMLSAKRKSSYYHFFKSLVWSGRGSNPRPSSYEAGYLPLRHRCGSFRWCWEFKLIFCLFDRVHTHSWPWNSRTFQALSRTNM